MSPVAAVDDYLLQLAIDGGLVGAAQVDAMRAAQNDLSTGSIYQQLVAQGQLDAAKANALLAQKFGMELVDVSRVQVPADVLELVSRDQALHYQLLPLAKRPGALEVAIADPLETDGVDALAHLLQVEVIARLASRADLGPAIERHYGGGTLTTLDATDRSELPVVKTTDHEENTDSDAPIIKLVHEIIAKAVERRASDIHLEPLERRFRVRYRIDGVLIPAESPAKRLQAAVISRIKIMAGISIAEKRLPQDGRIRVTLGGKSLDLRVSSLPTSHGEGVVMRILDQESLKIGLGELGFLDDDRAMFERLIAQADGIVLVTGPTGSGKTTTLYSCLHAINQPDRKIITVEDPVEYQLSGVNQVPVRAEVGMTFAAALRAMLRQAPNVVMVGEIRDLETAEIAIHASLTGHMVFSTLHTNDAPSAVTRLIDIGVKPFLVSTSLRGVLAQRLVRKVCEKCAAPVVPAESDLKLLGITPAVARNGQFRRGTGCPACHLTGYRGRMGIFEMLVIDDEMRHLIHDGASAAKLRDCARRGGMRSLREDGTRKVIAGLTTIEEVVSITIGDSV